MKRWRFAAIMISLSLVQVGMAGSALSATYYLSVSGSNSANGTSSGTPWKTFQKAFSTMAGGDELILLDGTYSEAAGTGYISYLGTGSGQPPSGTGRTKFTTVRAQNPGKVTVLGELFIGRSTRKDSYIKIQGITFEGGGSLYNTSYNYIKDCGFHDSTNGEGVFGIGTNDHSQGNSYNLIEDCWIWGNARLIASNYMADYNVWRRVVIRGDGCSTSNCSGSGNPNVGFTVYNSTNISVQNVLIVDRILVGSGNQYANFASAQHSPGSSLGPAEWLGCISLKSPDEGWYLEADSANPNAVKIVNSVAWDSGGEGFNLSMTTSGLDVENCTAGVSRSGSGFRIVNFTSGTVRNNIAYNSSLWGFNSVITPSYTDTYLAANGLYNQTTPTVGVKVTNPLADGTPVSLQYLTRIETGSALKGSGYAGADYGANVVQRYGTDGTFQGDSGYNTLSSTSLWPWPNEGRIKTEMSASSTRGFCAPGNNPTTGTPITLTSYVWEYLGNVIPSEYPTLKKPYYPSNILVR
jgi:hypothetical protein